MCPDCGGRFARNASHHRARYGGCCRTFSGEEAYDRHRGPDGCSVVEAAPPWRMNERGEWTAKPPMTENQKASIKR